MTLQPVRIGTLLLHGTAMYRVSCCAARAEEVGLKRHPTGRRTWWVPVRRLSSGEFTFVSAPEHIERVERRRMVAPPEDVGELGARLDRRGDGDLDPRRASPKETDR